MFCKKNDKKHSRWIACLPLVLSVTACTGAQGFGEQGSYLVTNATERTVWASTGHHANNGRLVPHQVICAEPSPDTAMAIDRNFQLILQANGTGAPVQAGGGIGVGTAESLVQLTQRMATIQLLRDGLYRACEAYANGAIGKVEYSILLSRFDDTMITMLLAELIAANFGGETAGGEADVGNSVAGSLAPLNDYNSTALLAHDLEQAVSHTKAKLGKLERRLTVLKTHQGNYQGEKAKRLTRAIAKVQSQLTQEQAKLDRLTQTQGRLDRTGGRGHVRLGSTVPTNINGGTVIAPDRADAGRVRIAEQIATMQRKYIENINTDALMAGCLSLLSAPETPDDIRRNCIALTQQIVQQSGAMLAQVKQGDLLRRDVASVRAAVTLLAMVGGDLAMLDCVEAGGRPYIDAQSNLMTRCAVGTKG